MTAIACGFNRSTQHPGLEASTRTVANEAEASNLLLGSPEGPLAVILAIVLLLKKLRSEWPAWIRQVPAYGIGGIAALWLVERVAGF